MLRMFVQPMLGNQVKVRDVRHANSCCPYDDLSYLRARNAELFSTIGAAGLSEEDVSARLQGVSADVCSGATVFQKLCKELIRLCGDQWGHFCHYLPIESIWKADLVELAPA